MSDAAFGSLADRADVDYEDTFDLPLERDVSASAHDDVSWVVANQADDLIVVEVVTELRHGIRWRPMNEHKLATVDEWNPNRLWQSLELLNDEGRRSRLAFR